MLYFSKSICILENDLAWRELMLLWLEGSVGGLGWWRCDRRMVERWCWRMREIECTPMALCKNIGGLWILMTCSYEILCFLAVTRFPYEISWFSFMRLMRFPLGFHALFAVMGFMQFCFLMVWCKDGGEVDVEGCGGLSVHDGLCVLVRGL